MHWPFLPGPLITAIPARWPLTRAAGRGSILAHGFPLSRKAAHDSCTRDWHHEMTGCSYRRAITQKPEACTGQRVTSSIANPFTTTLHVRKRPYLPLPGIPSGPF